MRTDLTDAELKNILGGEVSVECENCGDSGEIYFPHDIRAGVIVDDFFMKCICQTKEKEYETD